MTMCEYKIDAGNNGNIMLIKMFKMFLFKPHTTIADLNKCMKKNVVLGAYNNTRMLQRGICKAIITYKGFES